MERRFLDGTHCLLIPLASVLINGCPTGEDAEFVDYRSIDHDATLDDLDQLTRDEQEKYFDEM